MLFGFSHIVLRLKSSKDGLTVAKNFGYLSLLQIAGYVFPLITLPYLANIIGKDGFGKIAFASAVVIWFSTITDWGFNFTATRDVAQNRDDISKVSEIFSNVFWARCVLAIFSGILLLILTMIIPIFRENYDIIIVTYLMIPGHIMFPDWFFQAIERMKYTTIFNLLLKFIFTMAVFLFIKQKDDYILQPLFTSVGYIICGFISFYLILKKWGYKLLLPDLAQIFNTIKDSTNVFINNLMPNLYNSFSVMLLGQFGGAGSNGLFDGGMRFVTIFYQLQSVLSRAFFPFLSRNKNKIGLFAYINIGVAFIGAIIMFFSAPLIVKIFLAPEFSDSVIVLQILSVSVIFMALNNTYGQNYLIITKHENKLRNITLVSSVVGMTIAMPLVYYYSYVGAAITIFVSRFLLGTFTYICAKRYMRKELFAMANDC